MVMSTPRTSRLPLQQLIPTPAANETVAGEFWIIRRSGEDWPIVICDEEVVFTFFKGRVRPFNARQADGNWPEEYKQGGNRESQRCYPAVQLGILRFTWVPWKILEEFDKEIGQAIQASTMNEELAKGWSEAMRLYALEDPLPELKKIIRQQRLVKAEPKARTGSDKVKRKGTPLFKNPPSPRVEEADDEEPEDLFVQQGSSTGQRIKKEPGDSASFADMSVIERSTDLTRSDSEQPHKKSRLDTLGRSSMRPSTPLGAIPQGLDLRHMSMSRATPASGPNKVVVDPDKVTIFVGDPHLKFGLRRSNLDASPLLSKDLSYDPKIGWYVMSPTLAELDRDKFLPVGQYLMRGEYDPNIVDEGTDWVRLETTRGVQEDVSGEVIRSGVIYDIARTLEMPGLQDLAFRKLKALAQNGPHQPFEILEVVDHVFKIAQPDMKKYLVEYLAERFWNFVVVENRKFTNVMEADEVLAKRVFGLLAGHPEADLKNEAEEKMKVEEPFDERKDEAESQGTLVGDEADDSDSQELILDYNGPITTPKDKRYLAQRKAEKDWAVKEKAERDAIKKMTAKELLADFDAVVDQAASTISAANGTVSFGGPHDVTTATTAEKEKAARDRAAKERDRAVRETARELLADNDSFETVDQATSIISAANGTISFGPVPNYSRSNHAPATPPASDLFGEDGLLSAAALEHIQQLAKEQELEDAEEAFKLHQQENAMRNAGVYATKSWEGSTFEEFLKDKKDEEMTEMVKMRRDKEVKVAEGVDLDGWDVPEFLKGNQEKEKAGKKGD